ncbi:MAG: hypothetical protein ACOX8V_06985 [Thermoleophilia bacterium]|jgi:hypothetical protein
MTDGGETSTGRVSSARIREWLEDNVEAKWAEGPRVFAMALVFADDILVYLDKNEDWAEAHVVLGRSYERVAKADGVPDGEEDNMRSAYRDHARTAYDAAAKVFLALGLTERAEECRAAIEQV